MGSVRRTEHQNPFVFAEQLQCQTADELLHGAERPPMVRAGLVDQFQRGAEFLVKVAGAITNDGKTAAT